MWPFVHYWMHSLYYNSSIIDVQKDAYYIGFYSELFWYYPGTNRSYFVGEPSSLTRNGYNFDRNKKAYLPSVRDFFDGASKETGLTTYISTLLFAGGNFGATLSKAILDPMQSMRAVINWNIIPFSDIKNKEVLIRKLFFNSFKNQFDYLLVDDSKLEEDNYNIDSISSDLANMVYASANDTSTQKIDKFSEILKEFEVNSITDYKGNKLTYCSFKYGGDQKYLFFGDIKLVKSRSDESSVTESVAKLGFISSSSIIDDQLNTIINDLTNSFIKMNMIIVVIVLMLVLFLTIISSRFLADFIMNDVIKLAIKMKLAQNAQVKLANRTKRNQKIEFSHTFYDISENAEADNKNEIDILFCEVEDILKVLNMQNFRLAEGNSIEYNKAAFKEFLYISKVYQKSLERVKNSKDISDKSKTILKYKIIDTIKKWYNNLGWIANVISSQLSSKSDLPSKNIQRLFIFLFILCFDINISNHLR